MRKNLSEERGQTPFFQTAGKRESVEVVKKLEKRGRSTNFTRSLWLNAVVSVVKLVQRPLFSWHPCGSRRFFTGSTAPLPGRCPGLFPLAPTAQVPATTNQRGAKANRRVNGLCCNRL